MAVDSIVNALDSIPARLKRVEKSFSDLDAQRVLLANCTTAWKELEDYFSDVQAQVQSKIDEFLERKKEFQSAIDQEKAALDKRVEAISVREKASLARVEEQKDAAIAALMEERRRWIEEHLGDRASAYLAKEPGITRPESKTKASVEPFMSDVRVRPQLRDLCRKSVWKDLRKYLAACRQDDAAIREELPVALERYCPDPVGFVLKALQFYKPDSNPNKPTKNRSALLLLVEALAPHFADPILGVEHVIVPPEVKDEAKTLGERWRKRMDLKRDVPKVTPLDAQFFLQLLLTFDIVSEFEGDDVIKLVVAMAGRKQAVNICKSLGLSERVPDVVEKLSKSGKQLEALSFANAFGIIDKFEPVSMLKEYLKATKKAADLALQKAPNAKAGENEAIQREISALRAVLKAVENYKLGSSFPVDNLQVRIEQLEKVKEERRVEKRRGSLSAISEEKRPRLHEGTTHDDKVSIPLGAGSIAARDEYRDLPPYAPSTVHNYDRLPETSLNSTYGAANNMHGLLPSSYDYTLNRLGSAPGPTTTYSRLSGLYGDYQYTSALAQSSTYDLRSTSSYQSAYELGPPPSYPSALGPSASYQSALPSSYQTFKF